jgi:hypothetical protein
MMAGHSMRRARWRDGLALACPACGHRLIDEPVRKLAGLCTEVPLPAQNHRIIKQFIAGLVIMPAAFAFVLFVGLQMGWWGTMHSGFWCFRPQ